MAQVISEGNLPEETKQSRVQGLVGEIEDQISRLENKLSMVLKDSKPAKEGEPAPTKLISDLLRIKHKLLDLKERIEL